MAGLSSLRESRIILKRRFASQFSSYRGQIVYRRMAQGQPIAISADEHAAFIAEFDRGISRLMRAMAGLLLVPMIGLVIADISGILPTPDWVPLIATMLALPVSAILFRRAMTAPAAALKLRAPMGGALQPEQAEDQLLRAMPFTIFWPALSLGACLLALIAYAAFNNPRIFSERPWVAAGTTLFALWLFGGAAIALIRQRQLKRMTEADHQRRDMMR